jgi:hypothetical protein
MKEVIFMLIGGIIATALWKCKDRADHAEAALKAFDVAKEKV